ncbi:MAG: hypothetical protein MUD12_05650 [Spirochaetes bacterium]|jgi:hypothetical protein|nr:hypothetical protein [Spirochaetota bacterium]
MYNKDLADFIRREIRSVQDWIEDAVLSHTVNMIPVYNLGFLRLPLFFNEALLKKIMTVSVDSNVPLPPILNMLKGIMDFMVEGVTGITYGDVYFYRAEYGKDESLHFHEIIHSIQWSGIGKKQFILRYALELISNGYIGNFFEVQAYGHQRRFESGGDPYDAEQAVKDELFEYIKKN